MRIVGGAFRGLKLAELGQGSEATHLRPTTDRIREAIFNLLVNGKYGNPVAGARVLDLFAGTGALGLEALSRGADFVTFVENGPKSLGLIRDNAERARAMNSISILRRDATRPGLNEGPPHDLIFLDPPYSKGLGEKAIASCLQNRWIAPGAVIVWEEATAPKIAAPMLMIDQRKYGQSIITIVRIEGSLTD
ncbi:16S rRNA (guanine(966)-N(2))-methyltransferase RsmD [Paracoccus onubensis]|uniref:16S rRNA (Guanine(966)-N(2))-methyltransferase RsmD n=1 Tax=Paracoccus onubensis TaxID=1675788 RepID=A0A418T4E4_9RHOB|nr:16S rRNA (guanine(966)-N(2))-methyltransferase RsmD [Paracoccus onubensis]RJE88017.1 16S rRNA (guanine(966)-N(2))-methyltransferase RsmD [Paracoccus onubensis]